MPHYAERKHIHGVGWTLQVWLGPKAEALEDWRLGPDPDDRAAVHSERPSPSFTLTEDQANAATVAWLRGPDGATGPMGVAGRDA